ncbi:hypothetical protein C8Q77DRAFT_153945 [Trametes polyzona]|nr:hypothetical protein C8Q77DRAFT_153945 [Trametes polyzona]
MDPSFNSTNDFSSDLPFADTEELGNVASLLLGTFLSLILYGMSVHQAYMFFSLHHNQQGRVLKTLISVIFAFCMYANYELLVLDRRPGASLVHNRWSLDILNVFAAVIFCFTQSLFARRVYLMWPTHGMMVATAACILTAAQFGTAVATTALLYMPRSVEAMRKIRITHSALVLVASTLLAGSLIHQLRRLRQSANFTKTDHILKTLIIYTWHTGLLIGISSLLSLLLAVACPASQVSTAVDIVATQLYAVSLLAELNHRHEWQGSDACSGTSGSFRFSPVRARSASPWQMVHANRRASRGLQMNQHQGHHYHRRREGRR